MRWIFPEALDPTAVAALSRQLGVPELTASLLMRRGHGDPAVAAAFLDPRLKSLRDPFLLPAMETAIARVCAAIDRHEKIALYGDYDVDGVTSIALLCRVLRASGAEPACFLPHRIDEGYGLSADGLARCLDEHHPRLLIAVDCGTTAVAEIAMLREKGVDVIVLDHHSAAGSLPDCLALVNPKCGSETDHHLCSAGLAFKFAHALFKRRPVPGFDLRDLLDLVALGTVADLVPLIDENRIFVKHGLLRLADSRWAGLRALSEVAGLRPPLNGGHVAFGLGPRLNAAGRLGTALKSLELLLTDDPAVARSISQELDEQNRERRAVEEQVFLEAEEQIAGWFDACRHAAIVAGSPKWHPGVVGIVASRLVRRHHRPTIVVSFSGEGAGKGSGRSIDGFSLVTALNRCDAQLERHGGHDMAAGVSLMPDRFDHFRDAFLAVAHESLDAEKLRPRIHLDAELPLRQVTLPLLSHVENLAPFGSGHRQPIFYARGVSLSAPPRVLKEKHLSLELHHHGWEARAIWFGSAGDELPSTPWDVAFEIVRNEYLGRVTAQIHLRAVRAAEPVCSHAD
ncbi:MAG: single-stranded-DNA-specific exonuclease RecJ [Chthoniobacteraceae bacterium]